MLLSILPQLLLVPMLIRELGGTAYGIFVLSWSLVATFEQLNKSMQSGVVRFGAMYQDDYSIAKINQLVSSSFFVSVLIAVLICIVIYLGNDYAEDALGISSFAMVLVGFTCFMVLPLAPYAAIIQSKQKYHIAAIIDVIMRYSGLLLIFIWSTNCDSTVEHILAINCFSIVLARWLNIPIAKGYLPSLKLSFAHLDRAIIRKLVIFGASIVLASVCLILNSTGLRWLSGGLFSTSFVGDLTIMLMPGLLASQLIGSVAATVLPAASTYYSREDFEELRTLFASSIRYTVLLSGLIVLIALQTMHFAINLWVGKEYVVLVPYILVLFVSQCGLLSTSPAHHILKGMGFVNLAVKIYALGLVCVPFVVIYTLYLLEYGAHVSVTAGVALGFVLTGVLQFYACSKVAGFSAMHLLLKPYSSIFYLVLPISFSFEILSKYFASHSNTISIVSAFACPIFFVAIYYYIYLERNDKDAIKLVIGKLMTFIYNQKKLVVK